MSWQYNITPPSQITLKSCGKNVRFRNVETVWDLQKSDKDVVVTLNAPLFHVVGNNIGNFNVALMYMAAAKNIKAGELILAESPTLLGPQLGGPLICFNCCRGVMNTGYIFCISCKTAVLCTPKCTGKLHSSEECSALRQEHLNGEILAENQQIVLPIRCLLFKKYKPELWKEIMKLESHLERRKGTPIWKKNKITVEGVLREIKFTSEEDIKDEVVQKICGILDVNTFEVRPPYSNTGIITNPEIQCLRGLYLEAALMSHDCIGNTHLSIDDDFVLTIRANVDIPENSPIYFNYSNVLQGNFERKQHLLGGKYFQCSCRRCEDPTELGTEMSSLQCHLCKKGLIRPEEVDTISPVWECNGCKKTFKSCLINVTTDAAKRQIEDVDQTNVADMENLLHKLLLTFHPNHYLILELQQNLIGLYLRLAPNKKNLSRRIELCRGLLEVFSKIEPGLSRLKAITLYELQSAMIDLAHKQSRDKEINEEELIEKLLSAETTLREALKHLLYEPSKSPEGRLAQTALSELKTLRMSIVNIQKDYLSNNNETKPNRKLDNRNNVNKTEVEHISKGKKINEVTSLANSESKSSKRKKNKGKV